MNRGTLASVLALFVAASPPSIAADVDADSSNRAAALFKEGRLLHKQGYFELACERFAQSQRIEPTVGALLNISECHERAGRLIDARSVCIEAFELALARGEPDRARFAETRAREIDDRTPRLRIDLPEDAPQTLVVKEDGQLLDPSRLGRPMPIDPGHHVVEADAPGRAHYRRELSVTSNGRVVVVSIPRLRDDTGTVSVEGNGDRKRPTLAVVTAAVGGALMVAGGVAGFMAISRWSDVTAICPQGQCPTEAARSRVASTKDEASTFALVSTTALVAGGALLAGGLYFYFFGEKKKPSTLPAAGTVSFQHW